MNKVGLDSTSEGHVQKKDTCPSCNKRRRYVRYFNFTKNEYLPIEFGRCDREVECGYFNQPWDYLKGLDDGSSPKQNKPKEQPPAPKYKYVEKETFKSTLRSYESNELITWLATIVDDRLLTDAIVKYMVGTAKGGGTIFWQINRYMQVCTGQLVYYSNDGHRRKDIDPPSRRLFTIESGYTTCLFGEHLLYDWKQGDLVGLVESEKTAFICSMYLPVLYGRTIHWLATCGMNGLTDHKANALRGKDVVLCPDYHYHGRAVWGSVPMRRKKDGKRILVCPDGELVDDYVSYKTKLESIGCNVSFLDQRPEFEDGSDIADHLVTSSPMPIVGPPPINFTVDKPKPDVQVSIMEQARDESWDDDRTVSERMLIQKYGIDVLKSVDFKMKKQSLDKQLEMAVDPRVMALAAAFDCTIEYDY